MGVSGFWAEEVANKDDNLDQLFVRQKSCKFVKPPGCGLARSIGRLSGDPGAALVPAAPADGEAPALAGW